MLANASLIADFIFEYLTMIFNTYLASEVLSCVLALWVIYKVAKIFLHL